MLRTVGEDTGFLLPAEARSIRVRATDESNVADLRRRVDAIAREEAMGLILAKHGVDRDWFVRTLVDRSGGVWVYLQYVTVEIRHGRRAPDDLAGLPRSLGEYYRRNLTRARDQEPDLWGRQLPVLATLGVIGEPVTFELLCQLSGVAARAELRRTLDGSWFPFLQVQPPADDIGQNRYAIYHASVGDFLSGRAPGEGPSSRQGIMNELRDAATGAHHRIADRYLNRWGGLDQGLPELQAIPPNPGADDRYGLSNLTAHLLNANREPGTGRASATGGRAPDRRHPGKRLVRRTRPHR